MCGYEHNLIPCVSTSTEAPSASFSGNSYIQYELKTETTIDGTGGMFRRQTGSKSFLELEISLAFKANKNSGTIVEMTGQNDYAVLQVSINYSAMYYCAC